MRKRKAGLEVKERHGQTCVPGALLVRVDTIQAALSLVRMFPYLLVSDFAWRSSDAYCLCIPSIKMSAVSVGCCPVTHITCAVQN